MSQTYQIQYFVGANSPQGFYSLYDQLLPPETANAIYIIKGGPGCGKSTLMRQVAAQATQAGETAEYILCSGDPDSLDGVVLPRLSGESTARVVDGISLVLGDKGYRMLLANTANRPEREVEYLDALRQSGVDGVIFLASIFTPEHRAVLKSMHMPVVIVAQQYDGYSCVYHDDLGAARDLTSLLIQRGSHPAYIGVTAQDRAASLGEYPVRRTASSMAARFSALRYPLLKYRLTAVLETPANAANSVMFIPIPLSRSATAPSHRLPLLLPLS